MHTRCPYCGTAIHVEHSAGEATVKLATQVSGAIVGANAQMQAALVQSSAITRDELQRTQLHNELSTVQMQLTAIQGEIRSVQRMPVTAVTKRQMQDLRAQEACLIQRERAIRQTLYPPMAQNGEANHSTGSARVKQPGAQGVLGSLFGFSGRAGRGLYWGGQCVSLALLFFGSALPILVIPSIWVWAAVTVKRYHDRDKSGWWLWLVLIPLIGSLWQLAELGFFTGTSGPNRYGLQS